MKVLLITPSFETRGGVQNYCKTIHGQLKSDVELFFVGPKDEHESMWMMLPRFISGNVRFLSRLMRGGIDVVHINTSLVPRSLVREGVLLLLTSLFSVRTLVFIHGWSKDMERVLQGTLRPLFRWVFGRADRIIVLAQEFRKMLLDAGFTMPVEVETTFVDDAVFGSLGEEVIATRSNGALHRPTLLFLSRVLRAKGIFETLGAYALVKAKHPALRLIVAGDGEDLAEAKRVVASKGLADVSFVGFIHDEQKKKVFLESDIYILPTSYGEGLPISMVEAMLCGLPVITRPVGGIRDFFEHEAMGFMTEGLDERELSSFIEQLVSNKEQRMKISLYNHRYARARFMSAMAARRLDGYFQELA